MKSFLTRLPQQEKRVQRLPEPEAVFLGSYHRELEEGEEVSLWTTWKPTRPSCRPASGYTLAPDGHLLGLDISEEQIENDLDSWERKVNAKLDEMILDSRYMQLKLEIVKRDIKNGCSPSETLRIMNLSRSRDSVRDAALIQLLCSGKPGVEMLHGGEFSYVYVIDVGNLLLPSLWYYGVNMEQVEGWGDMESLPFARSHRSCPGNIHHDSTLSLLHYSICHNNAHTLKTCLAFGANPRFHRTRESPLSYAIAHGYRDLVKILLFFNADPERDPPTIMPTSPAVRSPGAKRNSMFADIRRHFNPLGPDVIACEKIVDDFVSGRSCVVESAPEPSRDKSPRRRGDRDL